MRSLQDCPMVQTASDAAEVAPVAISAISETSFSVVRLVQFTVHVPILVRPRTASQWVYYRSHRLNVALPKSPLAKHHAYQVKQGAEVARTQRALGRLLSVPATTDSAIQGSLLSH